MKENYWKHLLDIVRISITNNVDYSTALAMFVHDNPALVPDGLEKEAKDYFFTRLNEEFDLPYIAHV
jgi:hypothetical protein